MIREFLARLLIRNAMAFEQATDEFYRRGVDVVRDPQARALLERAAQQERSHRERLEQLLEHAGEESICTRHAEELKQLTLDEPAGAREIGPDSTPRQVLEAAIGQERASYDFYYLLSQRAKLRTLKETFAALALEERQHLASMQQALEQMLAGAGEESKQ